MSAQTALRRRSFNRATGFLLSFGFGAQYMKNSLDLGRAEASISEAGPSPVPMLGIWRTIRGYILWSYERGTIQYDIMVTLILLFVFLSPHYLGYNDKPIDRNPHPTGVVIVPEGTGFVYQIEASAVQGQNETAIREQLLRIIEPISGEVTIIKYEVVHDKKGNVQSYKIWAQR